MHEVSLSVFFYKYRKWLAFFSFIFSIFVFAILVFSVKPVQDDYATLALVSENGYINFLSSSWQSHGGNIWPMALHAIVMVSALESFNFISISIFVLLTMLLIIGSITYLYSKLLQQTVVYKKWTLYILLLGTLLGFEGVFTPGLIGSYLFSLASLVHLWPVCFFVIGISKAISDRKYMLGLFLLGIVTGNGNISESVAFILTILLIKKSKKLNNSRTETASNINFFFSGLLFGTLLIILAPGFWVRANSVNSTSPESLYTYFLDFIHSFLIFTVDLLSHPVLYIFVILGAAYGKKVFCTATSDFYFPVLEILFVSLFSCLVVGSVFAYPAWHQNLGLLFLLPVCAFYLGTKISKQLSKLLRSSQIFLLILFICVLFISSIRASLLLLDRSSNWKISNDLNICKIRFNDGIGIQNPEILYPPFSLGVEEVQSWPWISDAYIVWIKNNNTAISKKC
jgi:hypothetical protein